MVKKTEIPEFGPLTGVRVLSSGNAYAGPFAATMIADFGGDVIWLESTAAPGTDRTLGSWGVSQDRRNHRDLSLDLKSTEGHEAFLKLIKERDIFIESSRGGTFDKLGLSDEVLWEVNPKLVIVHVSGFGQSGEPDYVNRASWDAIGQAFSGYMYINGMPEPNPPIRATPYTCDYVTALFASWSALAALRRAEQTGKGDSIDVAQFEAMMRVQAFYPTKFLNQGFQYERMGNGDPMFYGYDLFECKDGKHIFIGMLGFGVLKKGLPLLGLEFGTEDFPANSPVGSRQIPGAKKMDIALRQFCSERDAVEAEKELLAASVPCSIVYDYEMAVNDPHYQAREVFTEWDNPVGGMRKGVGMIPKFKNNPGKIWRGGPTYGLDNEDILADLGYSASEIEELKEKGVISTKFKDLI